MSRLGGRAVPIDEAMTYELAEDWFPPFLDVAMMTPSHPLRDAALKAAEQTVRDSYLDAADSNLDDDEFAEQQEAFQEVAEDVIKVLRGVADWVAGNVEIRSHDA